MVGEQGSGGTADGMGPATDTVRRALAFEAVLGRVFERFGDVSDADFDAAVDASLADIGSFVGADRAYVIRFDDDTALTFMTHEWCASGIPSSIEHEQGRAFAEAPLQQATLQALRVNEIRDVAALTGEWEADRAYLLAEGISAILEVPLVRRGHLVGVIGFDSLTTSVPWTSEDITVLRAVAALFAQVTERRVAGEGLAEAAADLALAVDELRRSEARFGTLVDQLPLAVQRFDRTGTQLFANARAAEHPIDLAPLGELLARHPVSDDLVTDPLVAAVLAVFSDGSSHALEVDVLVDGSRRRRAVNVAPEVNATGEVETVLIVSQDVTARHEYQQALAHAATHDALTGLPNRAMFDALLVGASEGLAEHGEPVAVLFIDLDAFKDINDSLGHLAGDELLTGVASRLRGALAARDVVARLGGDEFGVLLTGHDEVTATTVAATLADVLTEPLPVGEQRIIVSASIGIAVARTAESVADLLRSADIAMYRAKRVGRGRIAVYDQALSEQVRERLRLDQWLRRALELDEIAVVYQPVIDLSSGTVTGAEALARWRPGRGDEVVASSFVPVAEENGTIVPIGRAVLREACRTVGAWRRSGVVGPRFRLGVNVSARQLDRRSLIDEVDAALADAGLAPEDLVLEVTETALIGDLERAAAVLGALRARGVRIAIDDFGTGYGSLGLLQQLPVDILKIDRSFVGRMLDEPGAEAITRTVTALAGALGLGAVAEGVETVEQRDRIEALGCRYAQGYLFARPLTADAFAAWMPRD